MTSKTVEVLDYPVSARGADGDIDCAWRLLASGRKGCYVACANPHSLVSARDDAPFAAALRDADLLVPDGAGIVVAGVLKRQRFPGRVTGSDIFAGLSARANAAGGVSYAFLGSTEAVLDKIRARMAADYPNIVVVAAISPPFKPVFSDDDNRRMIEQINAAKPDVLWVGMTAPKQEKWIHQNRAALDVRLMGAIGAVFDFYAGTKQRSPEWACRMGLEWLPRLVREPRRLWRRNFVSTPLFLYSVVTSGRGAR